MCVCVCVCVHAQAHVSNGLHMLLISCGLLHPQIPANDEQNIFTIKLVFAIANQLAW